MKLTLIAANASDLDVVNAARVSFAGEHMQMEPGDDKLVAFLVKNRHGTPFEHTFFKFRVEAPIFVFREWHRHRIGHSYNEMSGRYVELEENYHIPSVLRTQHGKPGAYTFQDTPHSAKTERLTNQMRRQNKRAFRVYRRLLKKGVAKEQARTVLPVGTYSQMIWSCNARSLMAFLSLRNAPTAMKEIRVLAEQAEEALAHFMPATHAAFLENGRTAP